jgi:hypothetical protein
MGISQLFTLPGIKCEKKIGYVAENEKVAPQWNNLNFL